MSNAEEAHDDMQVGAAQGVHNPADNLWHTTAWSAWAEDVASPKVTKRVGENCKLAPSTRYWGKVKFDLQRVARGENEDEVDIAEGLFLVGAGRKAEEGVPLAVQCLFLKFHSKLCLH